MNSAKLYAFLDGHMIEDVIKLVVPTGIIFSREVSQ